MKQWIIDRYNEGQDKYILENDMGDIEHRNYLRIYLKDEYPETSLPRLTLYDFLFDPEWGFAESFWKFKEPENFKRTIKVLHQQEVYEYIGSMAISKDPLKYLEQFKNTE